MSGRRFRVVAVAIALLAGEARAASLSALDLLPADAPGQRLTVGSGDASLSVRVDAFGRLFEATYDPLGAATAGSIIALDCRGGACRDAPEALPGGYVALRTGAGFTPLGEAAGSDPAAFAEVSAKSARSLFRVGALDVELVQTLSQAFAVNPDGEPVGAPIGARLTQAYTVTNTGSAATDVGFARLLDADLGWNDTVTPDLETGFDGSSHDDGGVTVIDGMRYAFQTDVPAGAPDARGSNAREPSFVGIAADFTDAEATRAAVEITDRPDSLNKDRRDGFGVFDGRADAPDGLILGEAIEGDSAFVDVAGDLAMALTTELSGLAAGGSATWVTHTAFGALKAAAPGDVEADPLLPEAVTAEDGFAFEIAAADIVERQTIFIDPPVAVGYTYTVEGGATVYSVTAPTQAAVPDADGYRLFFDGAPDGIALAPGETVILAPHAPTGFRIEGIDVALMLDPDDQLAFVTGIALEGLSPLARTAGGIRITQTPITVDVAPVPLPAPAALLLGGLGLLGWAGRRRGRLSRQAGVR